MNVTSRLELFPVVQSVPIQLSRRSVLRAHSPADTLSLGARIRSVGLLCGGERLDQKALTKSSHPPGKKSSCLQKCDYKLGSSSSESPGVWHLFGEE
jgi:hypothetical protein